MVEMVQKKVFPLSTTLALSLGPQGIDFSHLQKEGGVYKVVSA